MIKSEMQTTDLLQREEDEKFKEMKLSYTRMKALTLIDDERNRQDDKWGECNYQLQYWTGILMEEVGEYAEAVNETIFDNGTNKGGYDNIMKELTHVAAVAVSAMECLMRNKQSDLNIHIRSNDQAKAIKHFKNTLSDIDKMKIEEQKKAIRAGCDKSIIPFDLIT